MIPVSVPNLSPRVLENLEKCIETNYVSTIGPYVDEFERKLSNFSNTPGAVATMNGTSGLHLALKVAGVQPQDLVVLPTLTFIASANAISYCGADPWLVDVNAKTWTLDPDELDQILSRHTYNENGKLFHCETDQKISAIMPVHTIGLPANIKQIVKVAKKYNLQVIADGAAALGATYHDCPLGTYPDFTVFSFNGNKTVTSGGGGMVISPDANHLDTAEHLATTARSGDEYHHDKIGFNYKMTNLQAAVGCAQMDRINKLVSKKRKIAERYSNAFSNINFAESFPSAPWGRGSCWLSGLVLDSESSVKPSSLRNKLEQLDIEAGHFWKPIHLQPPYQSVPRNLNNVAEHVWKKSLPLPSSTTMTQKEQTYVIDSVKDILK